MYHNYIIISGISFTSQPINVENTCSTANENAIFPCEFEFEGGAPPKPQWIINSRVYSSINSELPADHFYSEHTLMVTNINDKNGSTYQCQVVVVEDGGICAYISEMGRIIITCQGIILLTNNNAITSLLWHY